MRRKMLLMVITVIPFLNGCLSLKEVNQYASASVTSLNSISEINYSFKDYCRRDCELQQLRSGEMDTLYNCRCTSLAIGADSTIMKILGTVTAYLQAVEQLSNNKGFTYDVSKFTTALQQNPLLKLSDQQVSVYSKAGNYIATFATAIYRNQKLKKFLEQADPLFQDLTETFIYLLDNRLKTQLTLDYETRIANLKQMLLNTSDKGFKQTLIKQFLEERAFYKKHEALLDSYVLLLQSVKKGHHDLYLQRNSLKSEQAKEIVKRNAAEVQDIVAAVKQ